MNTDIPRVELLVRGKKSFGHVKIDAKRVSDSVDVDWVQTFYFNSNNSPWWAVQGYGIATTDLTILPPRGIGSEFPSLARRNLWEDRVTASYPDDFCFVVYSTINLTATWNY